MAVFSNLLPIIGSKLENNCHRMAIILTEILDALAKKNEKKRKERKMFHKKNSENDEMENRKNFPKIRSFKHLLCKDSCSSILKIKENFVKS